MKKKLLSLLIITTLSIGITACGKSTESSSDKTVAELEAQIEDLQKQLEEAKQGNSTDGLDNTESSSDSETQGIIKYTEENAEYQGVCGADAKWYYKDNVLVIKGTGDIIDPTWNYEEKDALSINWLIIDEGITSICGDAFYNYYDNNNNCTDKLSKVILPQTLESISSGAFYNCTSLKTIEIPSGVTKIDGYAFCDCTSLKTIEIPSGVTKIDERAFDSCTSLENIKIPDNINEIGNGAFYECTLSDEATIEKIKSVNPNAFNNVY